MLHLQNSEIMAFVFSMRNKQFRRLKEFELAQKLGRSHQKRSTPSPSSSKSKAISYGWKAVIEGGAIETNRRQH